MITKDKKTKVIKDNATGANDVGSTEVQVAILTSRIAELTEHLKLHKKDQHSRRGLLQMVGKRKRLLSYLKKRNLTSYLALTKKLKIRV